MDIFLFWFYQYLTMKYKSLLIIFLMLVFGCSSDSEEPNNPQPNPNQPTQGEPDTTAPTITIGGLESEIEVLTTLTVSITDASNTVNTVILVNDTEVFSTMDKTISYELDPFDFPSGETTITVQSTDDSDNLETESESFELKKLLFRSTDLNGDDPSNDFVDLYLAINSEKTGELIASRKMQTYDDAVFYAPEDFQRQKIVVTKYVMGKGLFININVASSFASLDPGIELLTVDEATNKLGLNRNLGIRDGQFMINITDVPVNTNFNTNTSFDYGANGGPFNFDFSYDIENTENVFIYSDPFNQNINDYRYLILDEFVDQTVSYDNFNALTTEEIQTNLLPSDTESFFFQLRGYIDNNKYETDSYRSLYDYSANTNTSGNTFNFPLINTFGVLQQRLTVTLNDGREVYSTFKGLSELQIPDLSIDRAGDLITINGTYDTHTLIQDIEGPIPSGFSDPILFRRFYIDDNSNTVSIPFDTLEIPEEVILDLTEKGFSISNTNVSGELSIALTKREQEVQYQDRIFYYIQRNEAGDTYRVTFPLD